jgi:membrane-bound lytic murein transglycosylase D
MMHRHQGDGLENTPGEDYRSDALASKDDSNNCGASSTEPCTNFYFPDIMLPHPHYSIPESGLENGNEGTDLAQESVATTENKQPVLDEALDYCQLSQEQWQKGELEKALEALDEAYELILKVSAEDDAELVQQKEDLRYLISKRILEIYASRNIVVNGIHKAIPLEMNRHVELELKRFQGPEKSFFIQSYQRSGKYRPFIVEALRKEGLPEELSWLPLIESGFKVTALSKARALGLWQFIPSTGYKFGLKRNQYIDERIDPKKATEAAIAYMKELHNIFGDWSTVLAAYNCGEGRVLSVIRSQNINYLDNFWDLYERLPIETARYVPKFMAALHIINNPDKYGFDLGEPESSLTYETVTVNRQADLKDIASRIGMAAVDLKELNPELRYGILPPDRYPLKVSPGKMDLLLASIDQIPISTLPQPAFVWHRIRHGETLSTIARRYRTSVSKIMRANNMRRSHYIVAGKKIKIPQRGFMVAGGSARAGITTSGGVHKVRRGDSLWIIAKRYGTTTKEIQELNNLSTTRLNIGQRLKIPGRSPAKPTTSGNAYYVKRGDSPYTIARHHNMSLKRFLRINNLTAHSKIFPGQKVAVD